jgi:hypothetical protein
VLLVKSKCQKFDYLHSFAATTSHAIKAQGSYLVLALDRQLRGLEKDVDVFELMRRVQNDVLSHYTGGERDTPQISIFPHRKTHFCAK